VVLSTMFLADDPLFISQLQCSPSCRRRFRDHLILVHSHVNAYSRTNHVNAYSRTNVHNQTHDIRANVHETTLHARAHNIEDQQPSPTISLTLSAPALPIVIWCASGHQTWPY